MGRTPCFRKVNFVGQDSLIGNILKVKIVDATHSSLWGELGS